MSNDTADVFVNDDSAMRKPLPTPLPDGAYVDEKTDIWHTADGKLLEDDVYLMPDGSIMLYEYNFLSGML